MVKGLRYKLPYLAAVVWVPMCVVRMFGGKALESGWAMRALGSVLYPLRPSGYLEAGKDYQFPGIREISSNAAESFLLIPINLGFYLALGFLVGFAAEKIAAEFFPPKSGLLEISPENSKQNDDE